MLSYICVVSIIVASIWYVLLVSRSISARLISRSRISSHIFSYPIVWACHVIFHVSHIVFDAILSGRSDFAAIFKLLRMVFIVASLICFQLWCMLCCFSFVLYTVLSIILCLIWYCLLCFSLTYYELCICYDTLKCIHAYDV